MLNVTNTQMDVLAQVSARNDGAAVIPDRIRAAAVQKITEVLIVQKLMREIRTKPGMPIWRTADDGRSKSLVILKAGRAAASAKSEPSSRSRGCVRTTKPPGREGMVEPGISSNIKPRSGSKLSLVIALLSVESGVSLQALAAATGWLPHTTRAALTGLRKRGFAVERLRDQKDGSVYRIGLEQQLSAAA